MSVTRLLSPQNVNGGQRQLPAERPSGGCTGLDSREMPPDPHEEAFLETPAANVTRQSLLTQHRQRPIVYHGRDKTADLIRAQRHPMEVTQVSFVSKSRNAWEHQRPDNYNPLIYRISLLMGCQSRGFLVPCSHANEQNAQQDGFLFL